MTIPTRLFRFLLSLVKPFTKFLSIKTKRKSHTKLGKVLAKPYKKNVYYKEIQFDKFNAIWIIPKDLILKEGVILHLHGGGYICGDLTYAKGYGTVLASKNRIKTLSIEYRLSPENPFPAALEDALDAYIFLLTEGYSSEKIILCGESAGGGLIYSLCVKLKEIGLALPGGLISISPWTDLTMTSNSYIINKSKDPSILGSILKDYTKLYAKDESLKNPLISPLFANFTGFPKSIIFVGEYEILLDDSIKLHENLLKANCETVLSIGRKMWHVYLLYNLKENKADNEKISNFILEVQCGKEKLKMDEIR